MIIFRPHTKKLDHPLKFKLSEKRLIPAHSVKYLGVLLDEHLKWKKQVTQVKIKLNRAIGVLSKLRNKTNCNTLKMIYHSLFGSHLHYGAQNTKNQKQVEILQNRVVRKITFKKRFDQTDVLYKELNISKFRDILHLQNCLFMSQIEHNEKLAKTFPTLKHCGDNHSYNTRSAGKKLLDIPLLNTETFGTRSSKYNCITDWNNFRNLFPNISLEECTYVKVKCLLKRYNLEKN